MWKEESMDNLKQIAGGGICYICGRAYATAYEVTIYAKKVAVCETDARGIDRFKQLGGK